jgi:hypothetical protein
VSGQPTDTDKPIETGPSDSSNQPKGK